MVDAPLLQSVFGLAGAPLVMALVSILIKPFLRDARLYAPSALVFGIAWNVALAFGFGLPINTAAVLGVVTGLAAAGVYSTAKALAPIAPTEATGATTSLPTVPAATPAAG